MGRYKTGPRGPKTVSQETLSRLSDPARGKYTSPSREAEKDALFKQQIRRQQQEEEESDGASFFLTDLQAGGAVRKPPAKSSFRSRLEEVAQAAGTIKENVPLSPTGNKYTTAQRLAESKRKARLMSSLLYGQDAVRGARQTSKQNSQSRQAAARLDRVKNVVDMKSTTKKSRYDTGGSQMSRNRQAKLDTQAKLMRGRSRDTASYDSRTGRVNNRSTSRARDPTARRTRDRSADGSVCGVKGSVRERSTSRTRPEWIENSSKKVVEKEEIRKDKLAKQREERRKAFAERKIKNEKSFNASIQSNSSAESSRVKPKKIPTGVMAGSRSAASVRRRPQNNSIYYNSDCSTEERRAKTEQRCKKVPVSAASRRAKQVPLETHAEGITPPATLDSIANSLQYSVSSKGSPAAKTNNRADKSISPKQSTGAGASSAGQTRRRLLERKGLPSKSGARLPVSDSREFSDSRVSSKMSVAPRRKFSGESASVSQEIKYPERFRTADRDELMASMGKPLLSEKVDPDLEHKRNVESALKKAEEMSRSLRHTEDVGISADNDTLTFASLLATHAKRISGKLESAQTMDENYRKLIGTLL